MNASRLFFYIIQMLMACLLMSAWGMAKGDIVDVSPHANKIQLGSYIEHLEDPSGALKIRQLLADESQTASYEWVQSDSSTINFSYTDSVYWFRIAFRSEETRELERFIEIQYPVLDYVDAYIIQDDVILAKYEMGDKQPQHYRPVNHNNFVIPVRFPVNSITQVYIRVKTNTSVNLPIVLWDRQTMLEQQQQYNVSQGIFFGALGIMSIYNILLFISVRDTSFLYYVMHLIGIMGLWGGLTGLSFQYIWPHAVGWNEISILCSLALLTTADTLFSVKFLNIKEDRPGIYRMVLIIRCLAMFGFVCVFFLPYKIMVLALTFLSQSNVIISLVVGSIRIHDGNISARYYTLAFSFMLSAGAVLGLKLFGIIPTNFFTTHAHQIGSILENVFMSFAIANRMNLERRLRETAQKGLITAKNQAMASLKQYENLYNNAVQGLFVIDRNGVFLKFNASLASILRASVDALLGSKHKTKLIYDFFPEVRELVEDYDDARGESVRVKGVRNDGSILYCVLTLRRVEDDATDGIQFEGSITDVTEGVDKDKALQEMKAAEHANQAKSAFLANMSHEIRTPMNGVLGMVELLRGTTMNFHQNRYVNTIYSSSIALLDVINDILDYSKIESGKLKVEKVSVNLLQIVDDCASVFASRFQEKGLDLLIDYDPKLSYPIKSDPVRIRQILLNLLSNAFKFTEQGTIKVKIDTLEVAKVRISVTDTGIGLDPQQISRLFESFSQADSSTTRKYGGTGLGLSISKRLTELMGGEIGVLGEPGVGSEFWFTVQDCSGVRSSSPVYDEDYLKKLSIIIAFPHRRFTRAYQRFFDSTAANLDCVYDQEEFVECLLSNKSNNQARFLVHEDFVQPILKNTVLLSAKDQVLVFVSQNTLEKYTGHFNENHILAQPVPLGQVLDALSETSLESGQHKNTQSLSVKGMKALVCEDNMVNQQVIRGILKRFGADVVLAENGKIGFEQFKEHYHSFDFVLMDIEMPEMNGYQATQAIRTFESDNNISACPIFGLSAHALSEYMSQAKEAGMDGFVTKPVTIDQLESVIGPVLKNRKAS